MAHDKIIIKGACEHNLKCIDVEIPRDQLVVITGLSGSGKSTLAFDTIYAEGQRRYVESLSSYARQFLEQMEKPDVESIEGLSPAISIEQKTTSKNPRSTVGTVTEIYDYLRLLFARVGRPHCISCDKEITSQTISQMVDQIMLLPVGTKLTLLAPMIRGRKGEYKKELNQLRKEGFTRVVLDGTLRELADDIEMDKKKKHDIDIVVDRLVVKEGLQRRLADSLETALNHGEGVVKVEVVPPPTDPPTEAKGKKGDKPQQLLFSEKLACVDCGISYQEITPRLFSFNNPHGACPDCTGLGTPDVLRCRAGYPQSGAIPPGGSHRPLGKAALRLVPPDSRSPGKGLLLRYPHPLQGSSRTGTGCGIERLKRGKDRILVGRGW